MKDVLSFDGVGEFKVAELKNADWECTHEAEAWGLGWWCHWNANINGWIITISFLGDGSEGSILFSKDNFEKRFSEYWEADMFRDEYNFKDNIIIADGENIDTTEALRLIGFDGFDDKVVFEPLHVKKSWFFGENSYFLNYFAQKVQLMENYIEYNGKTFDSCESNEKVYGWLVNYITDLTKNNVVRLRCTKSLNNKEHILCYLMVYALSQVYNMDVKQCNDECLSLVKFYADRFFVNNKEHVDYTFGDCSIVVDK